MKKGMKGYFLTGLLIVVPLYITFYVLRLIVGSMDKVLLYLPEHIRPEAYLPFHVPGIGLLLTVIIIFIIGLLAQNFFGRKLVSIGEYFMSKIPVLRAVYKGSKQFIDTFFVQDSDEGFNTVVMLEYPRKGIYGLGFVTGKAKGELQARTDDTTVNVFIPTTPNPTSGFYLIVPEGDLTPLDMTVEDAFKVIMTGGMVVPEIKKTLVKNKLENKNTEKE